MPEAAHDPNGPDEAQAWRNQLALTLLRGLFCIFLVCIFVVTLAVRGERERHALAALLAGLAAVLAVPAFTGRPKGPARAWMVVAPALAMSIAGYAGVGFLSGPGACLTVTLMLTGLLLGRRAMIIVTVFSAAAVTLIGWAMVTGHLPAPNPADASMTSAVSWVRSMWTTFLAISLFGGLMVAVVTRMERSLRLAGHETARRQEAERAALEARQLELVGRLAAGIAHDFNNNLTAILGNAELLEQAHPVGDPDRPLAEAIILSSHRLAELTRQLLAYSRRARMVQAPADLHALVTDAVSLLRRSTDPKVQIAVSLEAASSTVDADATLLQSAILNLLVNARDAMPDGGTITVSTRTAEDGGQAALALEIRDTGHGIPRDLLPQIFDPFFTTKPVGRGTGLGLAAVAGTIKAHGGRIEVESEVGQGTVFRVHLPASGPALTPASAGEGIVRGQGHILLVEDDGIVSLTAVATLKSFGYEVTRATDGASAVALVRERGGAFDLVLLDLRMPGMSGEETFAALRQLVPGLRVMIWSGYAAEQDVASMLRRGAVGFVQKPYRIAELSRAVARALAPRPADTALAPSRP